VKRNKARSALQGVVDYGGPTRQQRVLPDITENTGTLKRLSAWDSLSVTTPGPFLYCDTVEKLLSPSVQLVGGVGE